MQSIGDGCVVIQRPPGLNSGEHHGDADVENCANSERDHDANGKIALGILAFLGGRGNRVEANIGKEHNRAASKHALPAIRKIGMVIDRTDVMGRGDDKNHDGDELDAHHHIVSAGGFADADHQQHREGHHNKKSYEIEMERPAAHSRGIGRSAERVRYVYPIGFEQAFYIAGKADGDGHIRNGVFED